MVLTPCLRWTGKETKVGNDRNLVRRCRADRQSAIVRSHLPELKKLRTACVVPSVSCDVILFGQHKFQALSKLRKRPSYSVCRRSECLLGRAAPRQGLTRSMTALGRNCRVTGFATPVTQLLKSGVSLWCYLCARRSLSQSSTSLSTQPTRFGPSGTRLGNRPAFSSRAMCCGEYRTSSVT